MLSFRVLSRTFLATALLLGLSGSAAAIQFTLPTEALLHTVGNGPGAAWATEGTGVDGQLSYDNPTQALELEAELTVLNYWDTNDAGCPTDTFGSNCSHNFATTLDITMLAALDSVTVDDLGGGFFQIDISFASTGGTDITLVDPTDSTTLLTAQWQAGTFQSNPPTTGLTVTAFYDSGSGSVIGDPTAVGFAAVTGGDYAQLFGASELGLQLAEFFDFVPDLDTLGGAIAANFIANGGTHVDDSALLSFVAEGEGQVFRVAEGQFVPEPTTLLLLGSGILGLAVMGGRGRR